MEQDFSIQMIETEKLLGSQFNPPTRIDKNVLSDLVSSMKEHGFWKWEYIKTGRDGRVADGHRRLAAAKIAGISIVPVVQIDMETAELWVLLNGLHRNLTSQDYAFAYANGLDKKALTLLPTLKPIRNISELAKIGGDELIVKIVNSKTSPGILTEARRIAHYVGESGNKEFLLTAINWLIDKKMQKVTRVFIDNSLDPIALYKSVIEGKTVTITASMG